MNKIQKAIGKAVFEALESRELMSSVQLLNGVLTINGTSNRANDINVSLAANGTQLHTNLNGSDQYCNLAAVNEIDITGGMKADKITVESNVNIHTWVNAKKGNDLVRLGTADDTVVASSGNDTIYGGGGNDQLTGGSGNDSISGEGGDDRIDGGGGTNVLSGGEGDDSIVNGADSDAPAVISNRPGGTTGGTTVSPAVVPSPAPPVVPVSVEPVVPVVPPVVTEPPVVAPPVVGTTGGTADNVDGHTIATIYASSGTMGSYTDNSGSINSTGTLSTGSAADGTIAVLNLLRASVTSGNAVHVDGVSSNLGSGTAMDAKFSWDFGDPTSDYNNLNGFNAAHVYDNAGTYTITLTVTDKSGNTSVAAANVTVAAASTRRTIYVSQDGNDSNTGLAQDQAVKSLARAQQLLDSNTNILFRRGDTWDTTTTVLAVGKVTAQSNILIGAFGAGSDPEFRFVGTANTSLFYIKPGQARDVTIQDITFDSTFLPVGNIANAIPDNAVMLGGQNITVRGCTFLNVGCAVNGAAFPDHVLVQDNTAPLATGLRANFVWGSGSDYVVLGNTVANSTREHCLRFAGADRVLIAQNDLTNLDRRSVDSADYNKKTIVLQNGTYAYVADNELTYGNLDVSTGMGAYATTGYGMRGPACRWAWAVVEGNTLENTRVNVEPNAVHIMFRSNVIHSNEVSFNFVGSDPNDANRTVQDVYVLNNTAINTGAAGGMFLYATAGASGVTVMNNIYRAPNQAKPADIKVMDTSMKMFTVVAHNLWQANSVSFNTAAGWMVATTWNNVGEVGDDYFQNIVLPTGSFATTVAGQAVGAAA